MNGAESPGVKSFVKPVARGAYNAGVSPGGNYFVYRLYGVCANCNVASSCVKFGSTSLSGEILESDLPELARGPGFGYHWFMTYDDLGNEIYVTTFGPYNDLYYWKFNNPGNTNSVRVIDHTWWYPTSGTSGFSDVHYTIVGVNPGNREWAAIIPTSSTANDECGYELSRGTATVTFVRLSATNQKVFRVTHTHSDAVGYTSQPFAGASRDGTKWYFSSNWCNTKTEQLFRVNLPADWWVTLSGSLPSPPSAPAFNLPPEWLRVSQ